MPIYTLSDGRKANVGPESEQRFLNDFADLDPQIEQEEQEDVNLDELQSVEKVEEKRQESKDALSNEQGIRDELKEYWTKVIESKIERQEMDINQIVNSFKESLKIIKIRKK